MKTVNSLILLVLMLSIAPAMVLAEESATQHIDYATSYMVRKSDLNSDGKIDGEDRSILAREETSANPNVELADINSDGVVDRKDFYIVVALFGTDTANCLEGRQGVDIFCTADVNEDGRVNGADRSIVVREWTSANPNVELADVNGDGAVNEKDRSIVVALWQVDTTRCLNKVPFTDDFESYEIGNNVDSVWEELYHYEDEDSVGGSEVVEDGSQVLEVSRAAFWHNSQHRIFFSKIKVVESSEDSQWDSSGLALVNPQNPMEKYEVMLYPNSDTLQVNYIDGIIPAEDSELSENIDSTNCDIDSGRWYYVLVMKAGYNKWKAMVFGANPTMCTVSWEDSRIDVRKPAIGIQSAGKNVITRFDEVFAI